MCITQFVRSGDRKQDESISLPLQHQRCDMFITQFVRSRDREQEDQTSLPPQHQGCNICLLACGLLPLLSYRNIPIIQIISTQHTVPQVCEIKASTTQSSIVLINYNIRFLWKRNNNPVRG